MFHLRFYDTDNKAIISPFYGFHRQVNEFDDYHRLVAIKYLDCNSKPSINTQDYTSKCVYSYDHRGNMIKIEHFDSENNPSVCKNGYARVVYGYDNYGNLASESYYGIDNNVVDRIALEMKEACNDTQIAVVVGGGNIFRGMQLSDKTGMVRATADSMCAM